MMYLPLQINGKIKTSLEVSRLPYCYGFSDDEQCEYEAKVRYYDEDGNFTQRPKRFTLHHYPRDGAWYLIMLCVAEMRMRQIDMPDG